MVEILSTEGTVGHRSTPKIDGELDTAQQQLDSQREINLFKGDDFKVLFGSVSTEPLTERERLRLDPETGQDSLMAVEFTWTTGSRRV